MNEIEEYLEDFEEGELVCYEDIHYEVLDIDLEELTMVLGGIKYDSDTEITVEDDVVFNVTKI